MSGWPPGGEAYEVEPVAGEMPGSVVLPGMSRFGKFGRCETADTCTLDPRCELQSGCALAEEEECP